MSNMDGVFKALLWGVIGFAALGAVALVIGVIAGIVGVVGWVL